MSGIFQALAAPFSPDVVSWRVGSMNKEKTKGMALAYIDARDVMNRLDEVVGPSGWQCEYLPMPNGTACCRIGVLTNDGVWVWKANGAENLTDSEKPDAKEMAIKGTYSDAFKRAAVLWGIGRYLYDLPSPWVAVNQYKQIEESEFPRLRKLLSPPPPSSPARKAGGSPVSSPDDGEPPAAILASHTAHINVFRAKLERCETLEQLGDLWLGQSGERAKLGIGKDAPAYRALAELCAKQKRAIVALEQGEAA